jgi:hypothetical protein
MDVTYFAKITKTTNIVAHVTLIENKFIISPAGSDTVSPNLGVARLKEGDPNSDEYNWLPVTDARGTCNVGYLYLTDEDKFIPPKPYSSWVLNDGKTDWNPPVPMPADSGATTRAYHWVEDIKNWVSQDL